MVFLSREFGSKKFSADDRSDSISSNDKVEAFCRPILKFERNSIAMLFTSDDAAR